MLMKGNKLKLFETRRSEEVTPIILSIAYFTIDWIILLRDCCIITIRSRD